MIYGNSGKIDRVTPPGEASRPRPRLALAGGLSTITRPFPLLLFQDWRKRSLEVCVYGGRIWGGGGCPGALSPNVRTYVGEPDGGRVRLL